MVDRGCMSSIDSCLPTVCFMNMVLSNPAQQTHRGELSRCLPPHLCHQFELARGSEGRGERRDLRCSLFQRGSQRRITTHQKISCQSVSLSSAGEHRSESMSNSTLSHTLFPPLSAPLSPSLSHVFIHPNKLTSSITHLVSYPSLPLNHHSHRHYTLLSCQNRNESSKSSLLEQVTANCRSMHPNALKEARCGGGWWIWREKVGVEEGRRGEGH